MIVNSLVFLAISLVDGESIARMLESNAGVVSIQAAFLAYKMRTKTAALNGGSVGLVARWVVIEIPPEL